MRDGDEVAIVVEIPINESLVSTEEVVEVCDVLLRFEGFLVDLLINEDRLESSEEQWKQVGLLIFRLQVFERDNFKEIFLLRALQRGGFDGAISAGFHDIMRDSSQEQPELVHTPRRRALCHIDASDMRENRFDNGLRRDDLVQNELLQVDLQAKVVVLPERKQHVDHSHRKDFLVLRVQRFQQSWVTIVQNLQMRERLARPIEQAFQEHAKHVRSDL